MELNKVIEELQDKYGTIDTRVVEHAYHSIDKEPYDYVVHKLASGRLELSFIFEDGFDTTQWIIKY